MRLQILLSIYVGSLLMILTVNITTEMVIAQNITDNATAANMTTGIIVTNGSSLNMTNESTRVITNAT
ncbi:MAG TPA: hypothetical protein VH415_06140 [Nitrososphaeraceae archaeon]